MKFYIIALCLSTALISNIGCECDCIGPGDFVEIRLMRDGKNAVFGPDAFIQRDSIKIFRLEPFEQDNILAFNQSTQTITFFMEPPWEYFLEIAGIRTDTLTVTFVSVNTKGCCDDSKIDSIARNGVEICGSDCEEVIELEI